MNIADDVDVIINGYAFKRKENGIAVLNLNKPGKASLFSDSGLVLETNMDDIELSIMQDYLERSFKYMEV